LPHRKNTPGIPSGWTAIVANDQPYVANFVKEFVNIVRSERQSQKNVLPALLQGWFGPDAGRPGTRYEVAFKPVGDCLQMEPIAPHETTTLTEG
jgi:hypothetical protein